jgi:Kdo2-lipid IVA lauroyltransferase/acyltransferase
LGARKKLPIWRRIRRRVYWLLLICMLECANLLPIALGRHWGRGFARFAVKLRPGERQLALTNIRLAYPELDKAGVDNLLAKSIDCLGANFFDILIARRLVTDDGWIIDEADAFPEQESLVEVLGRLKNQGKGVFILSGHLGCWELSGGALVKLWQEHFHSALDLSVVTATVHNPAVDRLLQSRRQKLGVSVLPRDGGIRPLLKKLDDGAVVAFLLDQKTSAQNLPVPFFGRSAPTASGLARIALKRGVPVLPVVMARQGRRHVIRHLAPIFSEDHLGSDGESGEIEQRNLLAACNMQLEKLIRRNPTEWVWFHNRWNLEYGSIDNKEDLSH